MKNLATTKRDTQQTGQGCDDITNTWFETETPFPVLNPKEFPTNEGDNTVGAQLIADCVNSPFFNLIICVKPSFKIPPKSLPALLISPTMILLNLDLVNATFNLL